MSDETVNPRLRLMTALVGDLLLNEEVAKEFGALMLKRLYGEDELAKQSPLRVVDRGKTWVIQGSNQHTDPVTGLTIWWIEVRKVDCRVEWSGFR